MNVRELVTLLGFKLDDGPLKKYDKEIDASKQKTGSLTAAFTKAQFIYNGAMKAISAGASLVRNTIIGATIEMEGYRSQMQAFTGSAEAAADTLAELRDKTIDPLFGTGNLVNAYKQLRTVGMSAEATSGMIDVLGDVANGSVENFNALTSVLTRVSTSGKVNEMTLRQLAQAGFGVQDMAQALGKSEKSLLADIKAGKVGYNELTRAMQNATAEGGRFYQNAQKQARTLGGSIKILKDTISSMGDAIGTNVIGPLTDMLHHLIKIAKAFSGSVVNAGTKAFEAIMATGSRVLRFFEILGFRIEDLGLSFEPLIGVVHSFYQFFSSNMQSLEPLLMNVMLAIIAAFEPIQAFVQPILESLAAVIGNVFGFLSGAVEKSIPVISGLTPVFGSLGTMIGKLLGPALALVLAIKGINIAVAAYKAVTSAVAGVSKIWAAAQAVLNAVLSANPIGLIILGVVALIAAVVLLVKNWKTVGPAIKGAFTAVGNFFKKIWEAIKKAFFAAVDFVKKNAVNIVNVLVTILFPIAGIIMALVRLIIKHWDTIKPALTKLFKAVVDKAKQIWNGLKAWFGNLIEGVKAVWSAITDFFAGLWGGIVETAKSIWNGLTASLGGIIEGIKGIWNGLKEWFSGLWEAIKEGPVAVFQFIRDTIVGIVDSIVEKFTGFIGKIAEGWNKVKGFLGGVGEGVVNFFTGKSPERQAAGAIADDYASGLQPAYAMAGGGGGGGALVRGAMNESAAAAASTYNNSSSSYSSSVNAPVSVSVNASGMTPQQAEAAVQRGVQGALAEAINGSRSNIPSPEARRR